MTNDVISQLAKALALDRTSVIVRAPGAIAEVAGPLPVRMGDEWLTLGAEGQSHVHVRAADAASVRYVGAPGQNMALEVLSPDGAVVIKVSFRGTNREKAQAYDGERAQQVSALFGERADA